MYGRIGHTHKDASDVNRTRAVDVRAKIELKKTE